MTGLASPEHQTFCHISEYNEDGYRALHAMIASSGRLVLWAPSSVFVKEFSFLKPREFLEYVDEGIIQIVGREPWIMDRAWRDRKAAKDFPGAAWDEAIDSTLRGWCQQDESSGLPENQRRVRTAPPERGKDWAEQHLEEHPELVDTLGGLADDRMKASAEIPPGSLEVAYRNTAVGDRRGFARWILRDAYNNGQAMTYTGPSVPFFLARQDSAFLRLLIKLHAEQEFGKTYQAQRHEESLIGETQLADQLIDLLTYLEQRYDRNPTTLRNFVRDREGRAKLLAWLAEVANQVKQRRPENLRAFLVEELLRRMPRRRPVAILGSTRLSSGAQAGALTLGAGGAGFGILSGIDTANPMGLASFAAGVISLAAGAVPTGENILRRLGIIPLDYDGPQWPFTFAFDRQATSRTYNEMRANLKAMRERR